MNQSEAQIFWVKLSQDLVQRLTDRTYRDWVLPCIPLSYDGTTLTIQTPSASAKIWLEQQLAEEFHDALVHTGMSDKKLAFVAGSTISGSTSKDSKKKHTVIATASGTGKPEHTASDNTSVFPQGFERYTLENFIVGPNCKLAFSAACGIVENYGRTSSQFNMNPLFIYGATGLGKTHLMVGIGKGLLASTPELRLAYMKVDSFFHEVTAAIRSKNIEPMRQKYQSVDLLLLDDIQTICKMERTQEEIFYIFEHLLQYKKQIVITSDKSPDRLEGFEKGMDTRLLTRCKWGLIVDLQPPDFETRFAILKKKLEDPVYSGYPSVPEEVLAFIANKAKASVRDLEGLLARVMFQASFMNATVTVEIAQEAYKGMTGLEPASAISLERICKTTADTFGITVNDLKKKSRQQQILLPRQVAMYLSRELTVMSYEEIGRAFNNMDHSTVINAIKSIKKRMEKDPDFNKVVHGLLNSIA